MAALALCLAGSLPVSAQNQPAVVRLSQLDEKKFADWLIGTRWEMNTDSGARRLWFAAPGLMIYQRMDKRGTGSANISVIEIEKLGTLAWNHEGNKDRKYRFNAGNDLQTALVTDVREKKTVEAKALAREELPAAPKMTNEEFAKWLPGQAIAFEGTHYAFSADGQTTVTTEDSKTTHPVQIVRPGLLRVNWSGRVTDPTLISMSTDLKTATMWVWWGTKSGMVKKAGEAEVPVAKAKPVTGGSGGRVAMDGMPEIAVKLNTTSVNALLVRQLGDARLAGAASALSLTSLPASSRGAASWAFNQNVGSMMEKALKEVARFHALRHNGWPRGASMQLSFADKFTPKDGPSAAVACGLLLESALTGATLDQAFAVTGDMNADGSVQPIGGVHAKLRGATRLKCRLLGIPEKNAAHAADIALTEGIKPFVAIQVFTLSHFDNALEIARTDKPEAMAASIAAFDALARSLEKNVSAVKSPDVVAKLKAILQKTPNHFSAKMLLQYATGTLPATLSPAGTLAEMQQGIGDVQTAINGDLASKSKLDSDQVGKARSALQRLRPLADARVRKLVDAYVNWANLADKIIREDGGMLKEKTVGPWMDAVRQINAEEDKLRKNESFFEELE